MPTTAPERGEDMAITVSEWLPGESPRPVPLEEVASIGGVACFLLDPTIDATRAFDLLAPHCEGLTFAMVEDLVTRDILPGVHDHGQKRIRKVSAFSARARAADKSEPRAGSLSFELVEFLVNRRWLIVSPHRAQSFAGDKAHEDGDCANAQELYWAAAERWRRGDYSSPGDLGLVMLSELTCSYSVASKTLSSWLDHWEMRFYRDEAKDRRELVALRGMAGEFRARLSALDVRREDAATCWFPEMHDAGLAATTDSRIDCALKSLEQFADRIRSSMELLQLELQQRQADRTEELQHRIERVTSIFLVPTLIAGIFGANTALPGGNGTHRWMSFELMVVLMIVGATVAYHALPRLRAREKRRIEQAASGTT